MRRAILLMSDSGWVSVRLPHSPPLNGQTGPDAFASGLADSYEGVETVPQAIHDGQRSPGRQGHCPV